MKSRSDDLEFFLSVVDCGGFSAAAKELNLPVAKISRAIQRLEIRLQTSLLVRTTRKVSLTEEGRSFAQNVREGLQQLDKAEEQLGSLKEKPQGKLRIDAASPYMLHQIVPHIADFNALFPNIKLELNSSENIIDLIERRTDLAIRIGDLEDSSLNARLLGRSPLHVVASPDYLARCGVPTGLKDLKFHSCLGFMSPSSLNNWPIGDGVPISASISSNNGETLKHLCLSGVGIGCFSNFMIENELQNARLIPLFKDQNMSPNPREAINAVYYRHTATSSRIVTFLDFIQDRLTF